MCAHCMGQILATLRCDMYTLTLAAGIPLSFRHLRDGRVALLLQAIHNTLTPRLIAIAKELATASENDAVLFRRYMSMPCNGDRIYRRFNDMQWRQ